jgi:hypothetical protein
MVNPDLIIHQKELTVDLCRPRICQQIGQFGRSGFKSSEFPVKGNLCASFPFKNNLFWVM